MNDTVPQKQPNTFERRLVEKIVAGMKPSAAVLEIDPLCADPGGRAYRALSQPHVKQLRAELEELAVEEAQITTVQILRDLVSVKDRCMQTEPVYDSKGNHALTATPDGDLARAYTFNAKGALTALDMLGKWKRMWSDDSGKDKANVGPGLTVIVQQGVQVQGQQAVQQQRVDVNLPRPG